MTPRLRSRRLAIAGTVLGVVAGVSMGIANARSAPDVPNPRASSNMGDGPAQFAAHAEDTGPGLPADQAIKQVLGSLGDAAVTSAKIVDPGAGADSDLPWIQVDVASNQGDDVKPVWLAELVQGAVADEMRTDQTTTSGVLGGGVLSDTDAAGEQASTPLGHGAVQGGQVFGSPSDEAIQNRVASEASNLGIEVDSLQILHPLESAVAVTFTVPDGKVDWTVPQLVSEVLGSPQDLEGIYVELDSAAGSPLLRYSRASRFGGTGLWFAPDQDERFGIMHSVLPAPVETTDPPQ